MARRASTRFSPASITVGLPGQRRAAVRGRRGGGEHDRAGPVGGRGQQRAAGVQVQAGADDGDRRGRRAARAQRRHHDRQPGRLVLLGPRGAAADQDHVGQAAQDVEQLAVGGAAQAARAAFERRGAVDAGHHVGPHPGPRRVPSPAG